MHFNREVRSYQEGLFFSLSPRQFPFALPAILAAAGLYFAPGQRRRQREGCRNCCTP